MVPRSRRVKVGRRDCMDRQIRREELGVWQQIDA